MKSAISWQLDCWTSWYGKTSHCTSQPNFTAYRMCQLVQSWWAPVTNRFCEPQNVNKNYISIYRLILKAIFGDSKDERMFLVTY